MRSLSPKSAMAFLLIFSLLHLQIGSVSAKSKRNDKVRAVFLGLKFENVPKDIQETLIFRMNEILEYQKQFSLTKPDAAMREYGHANISDLIESQNDSAIIAFAKDFQFDFVYSGFLTNIKPDENKILLSGELIRFDIASQKSHRFTVKSEYAQIGNSLLDFSDRYVQTLPEIKKKSNILGNLLLGGLILLGVAAISLAIGGAVGGDESGGERPSPGDE